MRTLRTALAIAATAALAGAALPAHAATTDVQSCSVTVELPAKLMIKSWNSIVTTQLDDPDDCAAYASWTLTKGTEDASASTSFSSPNTTDHVSFYTGPSGNHAGSYTAVGRYAYSDDTYSDEDGFDESVEVVQEDSEPMVAKYASKLSWTTATRHGSTVSLQARALRYSPFVSFGGYVKWKHAKVLVQKRVGSTWRTVKAVHTNTKGVASARVTGAKRAWRMVTTDSSSVWGKATSAKKR
jgi:hypothetical protein